VSEESATRRRIRNSALALMSLALGFFVLLLSSLVFSF